MPRDIVLGNGSLLINFDRGLNMRDLYYPTVGLTNHIAGHCNKIGVWVSGRFSWIDDDCWCNKIRYKRDTMVSQIEAVNEGLKVSLEINDAVHFRKNIYLKKVSITNLDLIDHEVRLFFTHDFSINESGVGDTAFFDPTCNCICHYKRDRYFLINGRIEEVGMYQFTTGTNRFDGAEGTWRDAEDGILEGNPISHGSVDSTVSFRSEFGPGKTIVFYYWIVIGKNIQEVWTENQYVLNTRPENIFGEISGYWKAWTRRKEQDFGDLSESVIDMYYRSLLVIRTQIDNGGAILAANDSDVLQLYPDHYCYVWPRDGALVAQALDLAGHPELSRKFFEFCAGILSEGGYFLHKYNADGTMGSSWHPWWKDGKVQLPIQEDETALVLFALGVHYSIYKDIDFIERFYPNLITKSADFLVSFRDPVTKLPQPSFDLWEERKGIFSFTSSAVFGALTAAASFAALFENKSAQECYSQAAAEVRQAMEKYLYCPEKGRFLRAIYPLPDGKFEKDFTLDSSLYGLFAFGAFASGDERVVATMNALINGLWVKTDIGGMARYTDDYYFKKSNDISSVPGNPWIICTLWIAEWYSEVATDTSDLHKCRQLIEWAVKNALPSGVLPEQVHPYTGEDLSVSPLTWSHSTFILAVQKYLNKYKCLNTQAH